MIRATVRSLVAGALASGFALPLGAQAALVGYVRDSASARGLSGAEVTVGNDKKTRTDKDGKYVLRDVPDGAQRVQVRLVGFAPVDTSLEFASKPKEGVFFLSKPPVMLDSVVSKAATRVRGVGFESFEDRRAKGFGSFLDSTFLRQNEHRHLPDLLMNVKGIDVLVPSTCKLARPVMCDWRIAAKRAPSQVICTAQLVLDGTVMQRSEMIDDRDAPAFSPPQVIQAYADRKEAAFRKTFDLNAINVSSLVGVEVYRSGAEAPDVYGGTGTNCAVIVMWTRR